MKAMKLLVVVGDLPPRFSGIGDYTANVMYAIARRGVSVTAVTTAQQGAPECENKDGVRVLRVIPRWTFSQARTVLRALDELGPRTLVNVQYAGPGYGRRLMINFLPAIVRFGRPGTVVVTTLHEFAVQSWRWRLRSLPFLLFSSGVIYPNRLEEAALRRWSRLARLPLAYIPVGSSITPVEVTPEKRGLWRKQLGFAGRPEDPIAVFFGGISAQKGFAELLDSVEAVRGRGIPLRLLILGGFQPWVSASLPYQRRMEQRIEPGVREGWIVRRDRVPAEEVSKCLHAADIALFPFPRGVRENRTSVLAALDHGLAVLSTKGPETPPDFEECFGARLVPASDLRAFTAELSRLLLSPEERRELGLRALRLAESRSWDSIAGRTLDFFERLSR